MTAEKNREASPFLPWKHPDSIANLVPQQPGEQSISPRGRPKGSLNARTIPDEMLHRYVDVEALKRLKGIDGQNATPPPVSKHAPMTVRCGLARNMAGNAWARPLASTCSGPPVARILGSIFSL